MTIMNLRPSIKDVTKMFSQHYNEKFKEGIDKIAPFYSDDTKLQINKIQYNNKADILKAVIEFGSTIDQECECCEALNNEQGSILISGFNPEKTAYFTFVLVDIGENHRFAIKEQVITYK